LTTIQLQPGHLQINEHAQDHVACAYVTATAQCLEIVLEKLEVLTVGHKGPGVFNFAWKRSILVDEIVRGFGEAFEVIASGYPQSVEFTRAS